MTSEASVNAEPEAASVAALAGAGLVDVPTILARLATVAERHREAADRAAAWPCS